MNDAPKMLSETRTADCELQAENKWYIDSKLSYSRQSIGIPKKAMGFQLLNSRLWDTLLSEHCIELISVKLERKQWIK